MNTIKNELIMLSSITYAYKAKDYLASKGITAYIERIPANLRANGCGYGIKVRYDTTLVTKMLNEAGIRVREVIIY